MKLQFPRLEIGFLKYGYANARVMGMKGLLLKPSSLDELIKVRTVDAMVELLQRTHYKEELVNFSLKYEGSELVELAAGKHFVTIAKKIRKLAPKDDQAVMDALLRKWDLLNLKVVLNAKRLGTSFEEVKPYLIDVGMMTEDDFETIANADEKHLFEVVRHTPLGQEMLSQSTALFSKKMWENFKNSLKSIDSFLQLQTMLDAYMYLFMDKALVTASTRPCKDVERFRNMFRKEIDAKNIMMIERLKKQGEEKEKILDYLIQGGTLKHGVIRNIIEAKDLSVVAAIIDPKFRRFKIPDTLQSLTDLEIALEQAVAAEKLGEFNRSLLSVGVMLGFLLLKEEEINNLRKIAKGKEFGISEAEVRNMIVVV